MKKATIYQAAGAIRKVEPENGTDFSLGELQRIVGGYIQIVHLNDGRLLIVNEEGKLRNLKPNWRATMLCRKAIAKWTDMIVGDALVCDSSQVK